jgi:hypothetical protein
MELRSPSLSKHNTPLSTRSSQWHKLVSVICCASLQKVISTPSLLHVPSIQKGLYIVQSLWKRCLGFCNCLTSWSRDILEKLVVCSASQIPRFLWNSTAHYYVRKSPPPVPILSQMHSIHILRPFPLRSILLLSTHLRLGLPSGHVPSGFPNKIWYTFLISPIRVYPSFSSSLTWSF